MSVQIVKVKGRKLLKKFIRYPFILYKGVDNWVPALDGDEFDTFNPKKNGAWDFCEAECYLAYKDGKIAGRVAAIINHKANTLWNEKTVRFGWLDFIEDQEVLSALLKCVEEFGKARGCDSLKGPLGFTDMDKEGLLVEGYDKLSPFTCLYNYPYYDTLLKQYGLEKEADWIQRKIEIPSVIPEAFKFTDIIQQKFGLHMAESKNTQELCKKYGMSIFHMYNDSFAPLFQFCPLTDKQIKKYLETYVPILDNRYTAICLDADDNPVGFAFCVPTLSKAVKKSNGKLFPFGFLRILRALKKNDTLEALLIGVKPEYQGKGAALLLLRYINENCIKAGIKSMIVNPQLEDNIKAVSLFDQYDAKTYMVRRSYSMHIK